MGDLSLSLGQTVLTHDGRQGIVRFLGTASFATGEWLGLELPDDSGKNDGSVNGKRYFECQAGFGIFIRPESVVKIVSQRPTVTRTKTKTNGTVSGDVPPKIRPSNRTIGSTTRPRQSLIGSSAPPSSPGSRLSLRSPTRSPTKQLPSVATSGRSTPRTITPTTTVRTSDSSTKSRLSTTSRPSMAPPPPRPPSSKAPTRQSNVFTTVNNKRSNMSFQPPTSVKPKPVDDASATQDSAEARIPEEEDSPVPPDPEVEEEEEEDGSVDIRRPRVYDTAETGSLDSRSILEEEREESLTNRNSTSNQSIGSRSITQGSVENRVATQRELEHLKAKIRALERKRQEDRDKIKSVDELQAENRRFEGIIQALQKKVKSSQQDVADLRAKCKEAEIRANQVEKNGAEHDTELEMATLDKEMAEERAETARVELEAVKATVEELELEVEVLRDENKELNSGLSPEEKASSGWLQMDRENERLREVMISMRDMSKQSETDLKRQIKELQGDLNDDQNISAKYEQVKEKLSREESNSLHWKAQLEAIDSTEEVNLTLVLQKEEYEKEVQKLKHQIQGLYDEVLVNNELEVFHIDMEKELQQDIDSKQAQISEKEYRLSEQEKVVSDLEYTLSKFRDLVAGLQSDLNELRVTRDISESEANAITARSRAIMDLNLKLQNSAAKTRLKTIDVELGRMAADESATHLAILQLFLPATYNAEKAPIHALLCFKRTHSKASLIHSILQERLADHYDSTPEEMFTVFENLEELVWIASICNRFIEFMSSCSVQEFVKCGRALYELEPVERFLNGWIEAMRRDKDNKKQGADKSTAKSLNGWIETAKHEEDNEKDHADGLRRMMALLSDLIEKLIPTTPESKASELIASSTIVQGYCESTAMGIGFISNVIQKASMSSEDEEEARHFEKRMDTLVMKSRTIKFVTGKAHGVLRDLQSRSMLPGEITWPVSTETEQVARDLSEFVRRLGKDLSAFLSEEGHEDTYSLTEIQRRLATSATKFVRRLSHEGLRSDDAMTILANKIQNLHSKVENLYNQAGNISKASEFEKHPAPWSIRSQEFKDLKIVDSETEQQLLRISTDLQERVLALEEKDRQLEEQSIKLELLESRHKEDRNQAGAVRKLEAELETIRRSHERAIHDLEKTANDYRSLLRQREDEKGEMDALRNAQANGDLGLEARTVVAQDDTTALALTVEIRLLQEEINSLQSAVRFLRAENKRAKIPPSSSVYVSAAHSWLDPSSLSMPRASERGGTVATESHNVFRRLLDMAANMKPVVLEARGEKGNASAWRSATRTPRYQVMKQREEFESWSESKRDLLTKARIGGKGIRKAAISRTTVSSSTGTNSEMPLKPTLKLDSDGEPEVSDDVKIVGSSP